MTRPSNKAIGIGAVLSLLPLAAFTFTIHQVLSSHYEKIGRERAQSTDMLSAIGNLTTAVSDLRKTLDTCDKRITTAEIVASGNTGKIDAIWQRIGDINNKGDATKDTIINQINSNAADFRERLARIEAIVGGNK